MIRLGFLVLAAAVVAAGCGGSPTEPTVNVPFSTTDVAVGTGAEAVAGSTVTVDYIGWLYSTTAADHKGAQFGSGRYSWVAGSNQAIAGFSQGVIGMKEGGLRRAVIPPDLGYGAQGSPPAIPGNSTLLFEMALVSVQ